MKPHLRKEAIKLRKKGFSYNLIANKIDVSKSSLSHWLRAIPYKPNNEVKQRVNSTLLNLVMVNHRKRIETIENAKKRAEVDIGRLTRRDIMMLGLGVYIGEGSKLYENAQIVNSDPNVVRLAMRWFKDAFNVPPHHFSIGVYLYPDTPRKTALRYWSRVTGIRPNRFEKTQVDIRKNKSSRKRRMLPYGTVRITVRSCGKKEFGVILHRRIMAWIQEVYKRLRD